MEKLLLSLLASALVSCATVAPNAVEEPSVAGAVPTFSFVTLTEDSHFLELHEWAERNQLETVRGSGKEFQILIVGCAGDPECFFVHEKEGRTRVLEPRLKKDWSTTLHDSTLTDRIREMKCTALNEIASNGATGECHVYTLDRTRDELLAASPDIARLMTGLERSPAKIEIIKKRKK